MYFMDMWVTNDFIDEILDELEVDWKSLSTPEKIRYVNDASIV